ncbi:MAG: transposase, partial [Spirochaetota bacterium]|nr:transposase [Spirochaetota bacterium]
AISDSKNQIILEAEAFGNGQEQGLLKPMIEGAKENANSIGQGEDYLEGKILISDTGSFSEDNLKYLAGEKIDAYIPDQQFRNRDPRFIERARHRPSKVSRYTKEDFTYREDTNDFICPNSKVLKYSGYQTFNNTEGRRYISTRTNCRSCALRNNCLRSDKTMYRTLYVIEKYFHRNYSEEMKKKIDTPEGRDIYSRRMGIIEPVFGNIRH